MRWSYGTFSITHFFFKRPFSQKTLMTSTDAEEGYSSGSLLCPRFLDGCGMMTMDKHQLVFVFLLHIYIPVATTNGTLRTVHSQHATGAKASWVLYTHSETICPMEGIGPQTGLEKSLGRLTNYNYWEQREGCRVLGRDRTGEVDSDR